MSLIETLRAPLFVSWQLTRDCDLACLHCCTDSAPGKHLPDELTADEALALADDIIRNDVPYVMLCGGEPLRASHCLAVAERLGQAGVSLKIETNGQLFDQTTADRLARLPIRSIQISLDGDTQDIYGAQRPGASLARTHAACEAVRRAGLPLEVTFAPTRLNIHQIEAVIERARTLGAFRFNTGKLMRIGRAAKLWQKIEPDAAQYEAFRAVLRRLSPIGDSGMQIWCEPFTIEAGLRESLVAPPATMLILPNGWVKVVAACGQICGDMRQLTLTEAWDAYCGAWQNETVLAAIRKAVADERSHADANTWVKQGVLEPCSM